MMGEKEINEKEDEKMMKEKRQLIDNGNKEINKYYAKNNCKYDNNYINSGIVTKL